MFTFIKKNSLFLCKMLSLYLDKPTTTIKNGLILWDQNNYTCVVYKPQMVFLKKTITVKKIFKGFQKLNRIKTFFLNRFLIYFLENFLKNNIIFDLKKCHNTLNVKYINTRTFTTKYFKKNLGVTKQILGVLYYSLLLKDASIFVYFFRKIAEKINLKLHKRLFLGLRKLIRDFFKPLFSFFLVKGIFFNVSGKIGVSGSAKKRRYFFFFGKHSLTTRTIKFNSKHTPIWTPTGVLGFGFFIFF